MVLTYGQRMRQVIPTDGMISLSRRGLQPPAYRITRSHLLGNDHNPWRQASALPVLSGGLLGRLVYSDEPAILEQFTPNEDDPAIEHLRGFRSLVAIPLFDQGVAMNMVVLLSRSVAGFSAERLPEHLWLSNLFGRATHNLVLSSDLKKAYDTVDRELQVVADIQRSLLPSELPQHRGLDLHAFYRTSRRAGGDYYDFFPLSDGRCGILIADVSGHGTPAAVMMAVTHSIAHAHHEDPDPPGRLLNFINRHLCARYTQSTGTFVTAWYGVYDPKYRSLTYANAGHPPPRHKRPGATVLGSIEGSLNLPLGIDPDEHYADAAQQFQPGDAMVFYTDGITEARNGSSELFSESRLDAAILSSPPVAREIVERIVREVEKFAQKAQPDDDQTLLAAIIK
jgi:sigma-B regulation protein RsbU (phosphoserine phosphatase)